MAEKELEKTSVDLAGAPSQPPSEPSPVADEETMSPGDATPEVGEEYPPLAEDPDPVLSDLFRNRVARTISTAVETARKVETLTNDIPLNRELVRAVMRHAANGICEATIEEMKENLK